MRKALLCVSTSLLFIAQPLAAQDDNFRVPTALTDDM